MKLWWILLLLIIVPCVSAGSITITTEVRQLYVGNSFDGVTVKVANSGDEVAADVHPKVFAAGEFFYANLTTDLLPESNNEWIIPTDVNLEEQGTYPLVVYVDYKDAKQYPFSSITGTTFDNIVHLPTKLDIDVSESKFTDNAKVKVLITNNEDVDLDIKLRIFTSTDFEIKEKVELIHIKAGDTSKATFDIISSSALLGSRYPIFVYGEYSLDNYHVTSIGSANISVEAHKDYNALLPFAFALILLMIFFVSDYIVHKKKLKVYFNERKIWVVNLATILLIFAYLLMFFSPEVMLLDTTTTGGDMGSHVVLADYIKENFPFKLSGYYDGWFAGVPMLQFYFIPPYFLIALLGFIIPFNIAFKLVTVLGIFLLPLTVFFSMRLLKFEFPSPIIASLFSVIFLFMGHFSRWGGNIKSTLAGQFPYGISLALLFLACGLIYIYVREKKHFTWAVIISALVVLNHIYTSVILALFCSYFILDDLFKRDFSATKRLFKVGILSFLLSSFWILPLFAKLSYSMAPKDLLYGFPMFKDVFVTLMMAFFVLAVICGIMFFRQEKVRLIFYSALLCIGMIFVSKFTNFLYIRFIPMFYIFAFMLSAYLISVIAKKVKLHYIIPFVIMFIIFFSVYPASQDIGNWIKWNYNGIEKKPNYAEFKGVTEYLANIDLDGRVDFEYFDYNYLGTPRIFEVSPIFTGKSVMEGLLIESSVTFPFFYYIQKEMSKDAWWPGFNVKIPKTNPEEGRKDLALYNVKLFVAATPEVKSIVKNNSNFTFMKKVNRFEFYSINEDSDYVEVLTREPVLIITDDWHQEAFDWISGEKDVFYAFSNKPDDNFRLVSYDGTDLEELSGSSEEIGSCKAESKFVKEDQLLIKTDCINKPLLVKISYFPNWKVLGAEKIYLVTPSLMLIFPEQNEVLLYYGTTAADVIANILTILGIILLLSLVFFSKRIESFQKRLAKNKFNKKINRVLNKTFSRIFRPRNLVYILIIIILFFLAKSYTGTTIMKQSCSKYCTDNGLAYRDGTDSWAEKDNFDLGYTKNKMNEQHDFTCNVRFCDSTRSDFVYVHQGNVSFTLDVEPNAKNKLVLGLLGKSSCRENNIFVDGEFLEKVSEDGSSASKHLYSLKLPVTDKDNIKITISHYSADCYGFDVFEATTYSYNCRCGNG